MNDRRKGGLRGDWLVFASFSEADGGEKVAEICSAETRRRGAPRKPRRWSTSLSQHAHIPDSVVNGFSMGALASPTATCLHPNHFRHDQIGIIDDWIADSLKSDFIAGPWSLAEVEATVGPIHASPLHIVTKTDENGVVLKHRVVYDASYPRTRPQDPPPPTPSINSQLDKADFPYIILKHYVDDFLPVDVAPPSSSHHGRPFELLLRVVKQFGWTIHPTKQFSWTRRFTFLGIDWDLDAKTASLTTQKQRKFMRKLEHAYSPSSTLSEKEVASIIGSCQHTCVLATTRRSKLNALYSLRNTFRGQHKAAKKHLPTAARAEVRSWLEFFQQGPVTCSLSFPTHLHPTPLYTDASDFGLGIVFGDHAITIPLPADYTSRPGINIGVGEAWAFELGVYAAIQHGAVNCILTAYVDNLGVVHAARRGRSRNTLANEAI
ncbi:hypothetical protein CF335_g8508, partial [Tilletia laevis]